MDDLAYQLANERTERLRAERDSAVAANVALRAMVEGRFDSYGRDGEPVLPRGWTPVDGGRLDELEADSARLAKAESLIESLGRALHAQWPGIAHLYRGYEGELDESNVTEAHDLTVAALSALDAFLAVFDNPVTPEAEGQ